MVTVTTTSCINSIPTLKPRIVAARYHGEKPYSAMLPAKAGRGSKAKPGRDVNFAAGKPRSDRVQRRNKDGEGDQDFHRLAGQPQPAERADEQGSEWPTVKALTILSSCSRGV